jgi:hypothetical protein
MVDDKSLMDEKQTSPGRCISVWTVQMGKRHAVKAAGIQLLDITAMSGIKEFAPDYGEVMRYKRGETSQEEYTELYIQRMRYTLRSKPLVWEQLKSYEQVALACYCRAGEFCHRHIFLDLMTKYLHQYGYTIKYMGEFQ